MFAIGGEPHHKRDGTLGCQGTPFGPLPGVLFSIFSILGWLHTPGDPGVGHIYM
jgi:hypothetical protein